MSGLLVEYKNYRTEVCDCSGHGSPMARTCSASPVGPSSPRQVESAPLTRVHSSDSQTEGQQSPKSQVVTPRRQISPARSGALSSAMFSISEDRPSTNAELQQLRHEIAEAKVSSATFRVYKVTHLTKFFFLDCLIKASALQHIRAILIFTSQFHILVCARSSFYCTVSSISSNSCKNTTSCQHFRGSSF